MTKVPLEIAVDSAAFSTFFDLFQRYQTAFEKQPEAWKAVGDSSGASRKNFADAAKSMRDLADNMSDVLKRQQDMDRAASTTARHWTSLARSTKDAASHIKDATTSLLKWAGITGLVSGLVGGGALYGLDVMANSVGRNRSFALGTGTSYGNLQSFRTNYGRLGDPEGILGSVNEARTDVSKRQAFYGVGMSDKEMSGDTADVASTFITRLKDQVDRMPEGSMANELQNRHITDIVSLQVAQQLKHMSREEVASMARGNVADRPSMALSEATQRRWQDFGNHLSRAGVQIETIFVKNLANIEPGLAHLSDAIVKTVNTLLKEDGPVAHWLDEANHGLEWLSTAIGTDDFKGKIKDFISEIGDVAQGAANMARSVATFVHWLAQLTGGGFDKVDIPAEFNGTGGTPSTAGGGASPGAGSGGATPSGGSGRGMTGGRAAVGGGASPSATGGGATPQASNTADPGGANMNNRGVKNRNVGNIGYGAWARDHGAVGSAGMDTGHGVAVFPSFSAGAQAAEDLALSKYKKGMRTADEIIAGRGGWTPGNSTAAGNIARNAGVKSNEDLHLDDPEHMQRFRRALTRQELGDPQAAYAETQIAKERAASGATPRAAPVRVTVSKNTGGNPTTAVTAAAAPP